MFHARQHVMSREPLTSLRPDFCKQGETTSLYNRCTLAKHAVVEDESLMDVTYARGVDSVDDKDLAVSSNQVLVLH